MAGIANTVNGGTYTGVTFSPDQTHYVGVTFIAACVIPPGAILENCTFQCLRQCGTFGKSCCPVRSQVGAGAIMVGGTAEFVDFDASGRWSGVNDLGNTTPPDCVDCAAWGAVGSAASHVGQVIVSGGTTMSEAEFCAARQVCTTAGTVVLNGGGRVVCVTGTRTVTG